MKLKRLELRGFKTFAQTSEFLFPSGITGLVGPNGSGKSNVADAIRWVLGEQNLRAVRGKRTDDVIFAGTANRAPAGMAEVSITLDNTSGWLPVAFSELTITRRAYRSGDNEYLLNNARVRLRDLNDLLLRAGLGESEFLVIGQGMVDLALSIRAEERRALIDEAADVRRFQVKLQETRDRLATSEQAMARARDLLAEIEPRLRTLQDQAERLQRHQVLLDQMRHLQGVWHRRCRDALLASVSSVQEQLAGAESRVAALQAEAEGQAQRRANTDRELEEAVISADNLRRQCEHAREQVELQRRRSAVLSERSKAHQSMRGELERELKGLREGREETARQGAATLAECVQLELVIKEEQVALEAVESSLLPDQNKYDVLVQEVASVREQLQHLRERIAVLRDQCQATRERLTETAQERDRWREVVAKNAEPVARAESRRALLESEVEGYAARLDTLNRQMVEMSSAIASGEDALQELSTQSRRVARVLDERRARLEVLDRWSDSQVYSAGVRAVLRATVPRKAKDAVLRGVIGIAADLLRVPKELETAIEIALGARAQDVVVERWSDAEAAIGLLKRTGAGRATFLPLDVLRPIALESPRTMSNPGVLGVAANLIVTDARYAKMVHHLLGRTLIVSDLAVARLILDQSRPGWQIVTVEGEIVRPGGAVTGGSRRNNDVGLLARQREVRELREGLATLEAESGELTARLGKERSAQSARRQALAELEGLLRVTEAEQRQAQVACTEAGAELRVLHDEKRWATEALARQVAESARADQSLAKSSEELGVAEAAASEVAGRLHGLNEREKTFLAERQIGLEALAQRRMDLAVKVRELAGLRDLLQARNVEHEQASARIEEKQRRLDSLADSELSLEAEASKVRSDLDDASRDLTRLQAARDPIIEASRRLAQAVRDLEQAALVCRERLAEQDGNRRELSADLRRTQEQIVQAQQSAAADLGLAVAEELWRDTDTVDHTTSTEELKRQIDSLRTALRAMGAVNPQAVEELAEVSERHAFLSGQTADIDQAVRSLQRLTLELQRGIRRRFEETFAVVSKEFRRYFIRLFGGGSARLVLDAPDDPSRSGIEIVAQLPGRRVQNLALLSGGERALTAVALLFAVLAVRPMPFCVLDEVDAALDEANVGRFGEALRELSDGTQFVVITHNRATMEIADSLYGVTLPAEGTSMAVSLHFADGNFSEEPGYVQSS